MSCGDVISVTEPRGASDRSIAAFSDATGISVYDVAADSVEVVASIKSPAGLRPRFRTPGLVSFAQQREPSDDTHLFGQDSIRELDLASGKVTELLRLPEYVLGFDWSPDGTMLAYHVHASTGLAALCLFDTRSGVARRLRPLGEWIGRDGNPNDEVSLRWSPAGTALLVVDTIAFPSVFVVDLDGNDVVPPRNGTFARWLSGDRVIFQEDPRDSSKDWPWRHVSIASGNVEAFGLPGKAFRPAVSPDGSMIAFDDSDPDEPSIYVVDIDGGHRRLLARGFVGPVWLGARLLAATGAGTCPPNWYCPYLWHASNTAIRIDSTTGVQRKVALQSTLETDSFFGTVDTFLAGG